MKYVVYVLCYLADIVSIIIQFVCVPSPLSQLNQPHSPSFSLTLFLSLPPSLPASPLSHSLLSLFPHFPPHSLLTSPFPSLSALLSFPLLHLLFFLTFFQSLPYSFLSLSHPPHMQLVPLLLVTDHDSGGYNMDDSEIGVVLMSVAAIQLLWQVQNRLSHNSTSIASRLKFNS